MLRTVRDKAEDILARCIFCVVGNICDILFSNSGNMLVMRRPFESMMPGVTVHVNVISAWATVLNYEEKKRRMGTTPRLFCNARMLVNYSCT
ncbi:hypothetical protein Hanom_Chr01g00053201 [Helianthus anomalus]